MLQNNFEPGTSRRATRRVQRRASLTTVDTNEKAWLSIYQRVVRPLSEGAVLTSSVR